MGKVKCENTPWRSEQSFDNLSYLYCTQYGGGPFSVDINH